MRPGPEKGNRQHGTRTALLTHAKRQRCYHHCHVVPEEGLVHRLALRHAHLSAVVPHLQRHPHQHPPMVAPASAASSGHRVGRGRLAPEAQRCRVDWAAVLPHVELPQIKDAQCYKAFDGQPPPSGYRAGPAAPTHPAPKPLLPIQRRRHLRRLVAGESVDNGGLEVATLGCRGSRQQQRRHRRNALSDATGIGSP